MTNCVSLKYFVTTEQARAIALRVYHEEDARRQDPISRELRSRIEKLLERDHDGWQMYQEWLVYWQQESESILREIIQR